MKICNSRRSLGSATSNFDGKFIEHVHDSLLDLKIIKNWMMPSVLVSFYVWAKGGQTWEDHECIGFENQSKTFRDDEPD